MITVLVTVLSLLVASSMGSFKVSIVDYFLNLSSSLENKVLEQIRLPRVLLAGLVGASLGISGASLQGLFRNPLADPGLIGVSAGAALGASIIIVLGS